MKSIAAKASASYRQNGGNPASLARLILKSSRFVPQVTLPGGKSATVLSFPDGSLAAVLPHSPWATTITQPGQVAVASEALELESATPTDEWIGAFWTNRQGPYVPDTICTKCRGYRPRISPSEDGQKRLGRCPNRCWG